MQCWRSKACRSQQPLCTKSCSCMRPWGCVLGPCLWAKPAPANPPCCALCRSDCCLAAALLLPCCCLAPIHQPREGLCRQTDSLGHQESLWQLVCCPFQNSSLGMLSHHCVLCLSNATVSALLYRQHRHCQLYLALATTEMF